MSNVPSATDIARQARTILGANRITLGYPVIRYVNNLESVLTYEGTEEVHALTLGQVLTGISAFRSTKGGRSAISGGLNENLVEQPSTLSLDPLAQRRENGLT